MVYNWRVFWWSLPWATRKEHMLRLYADSLHAHRASGMADDRWRVQYTFLGKNVCRDAFLILSGLGSSFLQAAREQALANKVSWSSPAERGLHGGTMQNNARSSAYLGARQWLEWYAETHSEWSPMSWNAYLPAGRKVFYYYHYRKDILARHGLTEVDAAHTRAYALASRRSKRLRAAGITAGGNADDAGTYAPASHLMADIPLADGNTFLCARG